MMWFISPPATRARGLLRRISCRACPVLVVALTTGFAVPAIAHSATAEVLPQSFQSRAVVAFQAAPGETNDVMVAWVPDPYQTRSLRVADAGAVLIAGDGCDPVDLHMVDCAPALSGSRNMIHVDVKLDDHNDRVRFAEGPSGEGWAYVYGGRGDDVLDARNTFIARLDGGGGRDELFGGGARGGYSLFLDGDRDGATGQAAPGPDVFHGIGTEPEDMVSYRKRTAPVFVDLAKSRSQGERGEGDVFYGIDSVDAGAGDDRLRGDADANLLNGRGGHDVLIGRGGDDRFAGYANVALTELPPPQDAGSLEPSVQTAAGDIVRCSSGADVVVGRAVADFTPMSCEAIEVHRPLPKDLEGRRAWIRMDPYPALDERGLHYPYVCSDSEDWEARAWRRLRCRGRVELRETDAPHRLLASGRLRAPRSWTGRMDARLALTALGRAQLAQGTHTRARVRFFGRHVPSEGWTIRLAGRRES